jgi:MYXO-CTERM domain-containing protein
MTKRRFPIGLSALVLGLALFGLAPSEAKAIEVMCSNEYGQCEVQNDPSWISCSCNDESSTGGTGGDEYQGLSEAELMEVCEAELSYCLPGEEESGEGTTTFGSDTGEGEGTSTSDSGEGEGTSTSDSGEGEEGTTGEGEGTSTTGEGEEGTTGGDGEEGTSGEGEEGTTGDDGDSGTSGEGDSGTTGETSGGDSDGESGSDGDGDGGTSGDGGDEANDGGGADDQMGDGDGCSVVDDSGFGFLALFGMLGLLGLRSRKRAS